MNLRGHSYINHFSGYIKKTFFLTGISRKYFLWLMADVSVITDSVLCCPLPCIAVGSTFMFIRPGSAQAEPSEELLVHAVKWKHRFGMGTAGWKVRAFLVIRSWSCVLSFEYTLNSSIAEINQSADNLHVFLLICGLRQVKDPLYLVDAFSGMCSRVTPRLRDSTGVPIFAGLSLGLWDFSFFFSPPAELFLDCCFGNNQKNNHTV